MATANAGGTLQHIGSSKLLIDSWAGAHNIARWQSSFNDVIASCHIAKSKNVSIDLLATVCTLQRLVAHRASRQSPRQPRLSKAVFEHHQ